MNTDKSKYNIDNPDKVTDYKHSNTHKISFNETELFIDFGLITPDSPDSIRLNSKISMPITNVIQLILSLFSSAQSYEKQYNKDIGVGSNKETVIDKNESK